MADKDNGTINSPDGILTEESTSTKHRGSMGSMVDKIMKDAADAGVKIIGVKDDNGGIAKPDPVKPTDTKFDFSTFKEINDKDYQEIDSYLKENKAENPAIRHRIASHLDDIKKQQKLASERGVKITELEKAGVREVEVDKKFNEFVNNLKSDFFGTYDKVQKEYKLPDISSIAKMVATGNTLQARVSQYQKDVLEKDIEKQFNIPEGTFVFDAGEAWKAGTPSYEFRVKTASKENELRSESSNRDTEIRKAADDMIKVRNQQIIELKDMYYPISAKEGTPEYEANVKAQDEAYQTKLKVFDSVYDRMQKGEIIPPEQNPFIFKNIFRGLFFDDLVKIEMSKIANGIHQQYRKHGLFLPANEMPTDVTSMKGAIADGESGKFKVGDTSFSPQNRMLKRVEGQLNKINQ